MNRYIVALVCSAVIISFIPSTVGAQTVERKTPRKYDKLLTAVEGFAKLNAQIEIREREYNILAPFVGDVIAHADRLLNSCDPKCTKSVSNHSLKLKKFIDALNEAHRVYQALTPNITDRNMSLMSEIKRVAFLPPELSKEKAMAALNQLNLENIFHYKQYANTYHMGDTAMPSLAASSDFMAVLNSFATTTDRLVKQGKTLPNMNVAIANLKNKAPDVRARVKALEDRRKSLVCTATLKNDYSVDVRCTPSY